MDRDLRARCHCFAEGIVCYSSLDWPTRSEVAFHLGGAKKKTPPSGWLSRVKVLGGVPPLPVKMRLNLEESLWKKICRKPAAMMNRKFLLHHCHRRPRRRHQRHSRYLDRIEARLFPTRFFVTFRIARVRQQAFYRGLRLFRPAH